MDEKNSFMIFISLIIISFKKEQNFEKTIVSIYFSAMDPDLRRVLHLLKKYITFNIEMRNFLC